MDEISASKILELLLHLERKHVEGVEVDVLLDILLEGVLRFTDSKFGYIAEVKNAESEKTADNPEGKYLHCHAISDVSWDQVSKDIYTNKIRDGFAFTNPHSVFYKTLFGGKVLIVNDLSKYLESKEDRQPLYPKGHPVVMTFATIPLKYRGEVIGQIGIANRETPYTMELLNQIRGLFSRAVNIITNNRLQVKHDKLIMQQTARRAKNVVLANVSHEVRTPLNTILGMISLMLETELDDNQYKCLLIARESCYDLLGIITEILDINKLEAGKMKLKYSPVDLSELIESCYDLIGIDAKRKMLDIKYIIHENVPPVVLADKQRIKQMIGNLLSNAVKFTEHGHVITEIELVDENEIRKLGLKSLEFYNSNMMEVFTQKETDKNPMYDEAMVGEWKYLKIRVDDTGIGIRKEDVDKLFKSYHQLDDSSTKKYKGTGLGLAITSELCKLMKGYIGVNSEYGKGSVFYFVIPLREYRDFKGKVDLSVLENKTFLVVDDNEQNLTRLTNLLDKWDVDYRECSSAKRALSYVNKPKYKFDLGLLDIVMPNMDGNTLAARITRSENSFPLIALSSKDDGDLSDAFAVQISKPYTDEQLLEAVCRVLSTVEQEIYSSEECDSLHSSTQSSDEVDINAKYTQVLDICDTNLSRRNSISPKPVSPSKKLIRQRRQMLIDNYYQKAENNEINILVVEDQEHNRIMLTMMLENIGYHNIDFAVSGEEAISMVKNNRGKPRKRGEKSQYDLILMDIKMPGKYDGVEASRRITKLFHSLQLRPKIVAVTASVLDGAEERYKKEGKMDGYISKPIDNIPKITKELRKLGFV